MLAGDGSTAGTSYTAMLARGTSLKYYTPAGDQVSLRITGGGIIDDLLSGSGQGIKLSVVGEVPHHTVLSGSVRKVRRRNWPGLSRSHDLGTGQLRRCPREDVFAAVPGRPVSVFIRFCGLAGRQAADRSVPTRNERQLTPGDHAQARGSQALDRHVQDHEPALPFVPPSTRKARKRSATR